MLGTTNIKNPRENTELDWLLNMKRLSFMLALWLVCATSALPQTTVAVSASPEAPLNAFLGGHNLTDGLKPEVLRFDPFTWPSEIPQDCPFERSGSFHAIRFLGVKSGFRYGDTWYPTWAENDILYSPWTDGKTKRLDGYTDWSQSWVDPVHITTGQGVILGDDPLNLIAYSIGLDKSSPAAPYAGRYPCGSLIHNGVWYYGTYCLGPGDGVHYGKMRLNWPWIGPLSASGPRPITATTGRRRPTRRPN
ncbi:MAG TPA: hypothetical protein PLT20_13170, partial [Sedimentisphaerales bacterium]|nr:hypothetical protein [Sedimentisphaerales bacterium]